LVDGGDQRTHVRRRLHRKGGRARGPTLHARFPLRADEAVPFVLGIFDLLADAQLEGFRAGAQRVGEAALREQQPRHGERPLSALAWFGTLAGSDQSS